MAEIRKHQEKTEGLAAAVRAAIGEDVRPNEPGAKPEPVVEASPTLSAGSFLTFGAGAFVSLPGNQDAASEGLADHGE